MNLRLAILVAFIAGFVSISMEIIWFSIIGYMFKGHAFTFGVVLALILFGIAFGAKLGYRAVKKPGRNVVKLISDVLLIGGIINFLGFPLIAWLMTIHSVFSPLLAFSIIGISGLLGCIFPLLCHITVAADEKKVGSQTSYLYGANIIGATTGPLITGYILLDYFHEHIIITGLCIMLIVLAVALRFYGSSFKQNAKFIAFGLSFMVAAVFVTNPLYTDFLAHIHYQGDFSDEKKFKHVLQNRSGTITVDQEDRFFGGGAYDGAINTDPSEYNINAIDRAYMVAAMHRNPETVLLIGLSSGSWAKVLADYTPVKELTIIEINPGYVEVIRNYPEIASILSDPKVNIIIDDGRRWLKRNPERKFDLIVMNSPYHWRQNSTNLLSMEFLSLAKNNLSENGVMYWNTTKSDDVIYTAAHVFSHVTSYGTFVAASDRPFDMTTAERETNFMKMHRFGQPLFAQEQFKNRYSQLLNTPLPELHDSILAQNLLLITDNNMAAEYKVDIWKFVVSLGAAGEKK